MLNDIVNLLAEAERSADRVSDLCRHGGLVDIELSRLAAVVATVVGGCPDGVPPELRDRWHALGVRVAAARSAAEARRAALGAELEQTASKVRVRRAYIRPTG